jgi:hypothetical protein
MGYENYRQADNEARYLESRECLIIEKDATIAQQRADIAALVRFVGLLDGPDAWLWNNCGYERAAIQPIIERYRDE